MIIERSYALSDAGYDVWMGNARGNTYSREHVRYDPIGNKWHRENFWDFSWHEIGIIDVPTMIDYVLASTGYSQLHYIGHSQGTTSFFVMCSEKPEYNKKIKLMHALAPVAYMKHAVSPVLLFSTIDHMLEVLANFAGVYEFLPGGALFKILGQQFCRGSAPTVVLCESILFLITGFNAKNLNTTIFPIFVSHTPAGASTYQLLHYAQEGRSNRFAQFDWANPLKNYVKYGSFQPPAYNLKNVRVPVILHYADNDWLAGVPDVKRLHAELPNSIENHIPDSQFEHMDFVWGSGTKSLLYNDIIDSLKLYDRHAYH